MPKKETVAACLALCLAGGGGTFHNLIASYQMAHTKGVVTPKIQQGEALRV